MREIKTGQIFTAQQALRLGLVDKIGFLEDATERVAELAALNDGEYRVVRYQQPIGLVDTLLGGQMLQNKESQFTLSDWATPRAYYLSTWLPALTQNIFELYR